MRKLFSSLVLLAAGLLVGTNAWADTMRIPQIKPMPQIVEEVFDDADALVAEDGFRHLPIKEACATPAPRRIAQNLMEVTVHQVSTEAELTQAITDAVDGDEIKLTEDITLTSSLNVLKAITLNLGGKNISGSVNPLIDIKPTSKGVVTILGNSVGETPMGGIASSYQSTGSDATGANTIMIEKGSLNVESGTLSSTDTNFPIVILMYGGNALTLGEDVNVTCDLSHGYSIYNATNNTSFNIANSVDMANAANAHIVNSGTLNLYGTRTYTNTYSIENSGTLNVYGAITCEESSLINTGNITFYNGIYDKSYKTLVENNLASGKVLWEAKSTVSVQKSDATVFAQNGEYKYASTAAAIADAEAGDEIDLCCGQQMATLTINKAITLDLNGNILRTTTNYARISGVNATIKDSKGTGQYQGMGANAGFWIDVNSTLTIDGVNAYFNGKGYAAFLMYGSNSTLNVNNSTVQIEEDGYYGFWDYTGSCNINLTDSKITSQYDVFSMQGGTLTCTKTDITFVDTRDEESTGIYLAKGSTLVYNSGNLIVRNSTSEFGEAIAVWDDNDHVTIKGGSITAETYAIVGNGSGTTNSVINIKGGTLTSIDGPCIYHPHTGTLTITDGTLTGTLSCIEIRAGELNISGGTFISTWKAKESESVGNGSGTTTVGAAIAVAQHTTLHPITVTITGGDFEGIIPVKLANPQNNSEEDINKVSVAINDGRYKVVNGAGAPFWSVTDKFAVSAGKFSHMPAYVVEGKTVVPNTGDDKDTYPWAIGEVNETPITPTGDITWQTGTDWPDNKVPTSQDKVTLTNGQNITVSGSSDEVAEAYGITIPTGATLTVQSGATLVVGGGGITNEGGEANINGLKVEPGAQVYISPDADLTSLYGRVAFKPNVGKYPTGIVGMFVSKPNRYQLMGVPTKDEPIVTKSGDDGDGFKLNQWDVENGWMAATISDFEPFKGFFFWNDVDLAMDATDDASRVTYYFKGELFGNKPKTLVFTEHEGFHLFANSYLAEVDIMALIQGAENNVQKAVYVYDPVQERFLDISYATYGKPGVPSAIQPMQGFYFLNQHNGTTTAPMDYVSMVWSNAFKVEQEIVSTAPARQQSEQMTEVRVSLTDNVIGRNDGVYLMEREEVNEDANIRKMMNPATSVNVYVANENTQLSQMQTTNLDGQALTITTNAAISYTFSFDWVQGEQYYLNDAVTGISTPMSEGNTYTFTAQPNSTITGRFTVVRYAPSVVTDIQTVDAIYAVKGIYTIAGQYVGNEQAWESLPAGVYIVNGEKMVK